MANKVISQVRFVPVCAVGTEVRGGIVQRSVLQNETSKGWIVGTFRLRGLLEGDCVYVSRTSTRTPYLTSPSCVSVVLVKRELVFHA